MAVWYVDTSAIAKLVRPERETDALISALRTRRWVVSDLHRTELRRAAMRAGGSALADAERLLAELDVLRIEADTFDAAGRIEPVDLRSLDALHLAVARLLGPELAGIVTYDTRLTAAARQHGIEVLAPP